MHRAVDISVGSLSPTINWGTLKHQEFLLPPKEQQAKIAELLWAADEMVERLIITGKKLFDLKKTFFRNSIKSEIFIPLFKLANISYGLGQPPEKDDNGIVVIRATNIKRGKIIEENLLRVRASAIPKGKNVELCEGDIIVVRSGAYTGDVAMIPKNWEGAVGGYDLIIRPIRAKVNSI